MLGVLVGLVAEPFPRLDVAVKFPLLLVDERLNVDARQLAAVLVQVQLELGPLGCDRQRQVLYHRHVKYSLDFFLRASKTTGAFEAVDWLAALPQRTWPQAGRR